MAPTSSPPDTGSVADQINQQILAVSEDRIQGFDPQPLHTIAEVANLKLGVVIERLQAMLRSGAIRRIRQTLLATSLAPGALVAWKVPPKKLTDAFEFMANHDPFSGHIVTRTTDRETPGSHYRLWTTLKVPVGYAMTKHADYLAAQTGAEAYRLLPAKKLFALGVGHVRRKGLEPGSRSDEPGRVIDTNVVDLDDRQWRVLTALKREFEPDELVPDLWAARASEAGETLDGFLKVARGLAEAGVVGRFSTFLEHVKPHSDGQRVTRFNALFHWKVPQGREIDAGREVGRHHCMTHAYWREGGPEFADVNVMGVAHGTEKDKVLAHKAAIDEHLEEAGIAVEYTNVFWGGRSEITPSEISPLAYAEWCGHRGLDPATMRD
ncbi:MAG: Lrp/AsnC family transcriptional regulator [Planctomycetota bacterium]